MSSHAVETILILLVLDVKEKIKSGDFPCSHNNYG